MAASELAHAAAPSLPPRIRLVAAGGEPAFHILRYGSPGYAQLAVTSGPRLLTGAHDEAEPGVYHHLFGPWRATNLRVRLDEYLRVGLQAGILYEN